MKFFLLVAAILPAVSLAAPASITLKADVKIQLPIIPAIKQLSSDVVALTNIVTEFEGDFATALALKADAFKLVGDLQFAINVMENMVDVTVKESAHIRVLLGGLERDIVGLVKVVAGKKGLLDTIMLDAGSLTSFILADLKQVEALIGGFCQTLLSKLVEPIAGEVEEIAQSIIKAVGILVKILI